MKKLKEQYRRVKVYNSRYVWYPNARCCNFRRIKTTQEKSIQSLHEIELIDYNIKLRPKRGNLLPTAWDDFRAETYFVDKSWKHNSRRKKQYYKDTYSM